MSGPEQASQGRGNAGAVSVRRLGGNGGPFPGHPVTRIDRADGRLCCRAAGYICGERKGGAVAQQVSVTYACDYDDKEIPDGQHRSLTFGLDGQEYEIDLCMKHGDRFGEIVGKFTEHARRQSLRGTAPKRRRRTVATRQRSAEIRAWAKRAGIEVSDRGRIPAQVIRSYEASHR